MVGKRNERGMYPPVLMKEPQANTVSRPQPEGKHPIPHLPTSQELELTSAQGAADGSSGGLKQATSAHNNAQTQRSSAAESSQVRQAPAEMGAEQQQSAPNPHSTQTQQSSAVESLQVLQASAETGAEQLSASSPMTQAQQTPAVESSRMLQASAETGAEQQSAPNRSSTQAQQSSEVQSPQPPAGIGAEQQQSAPSQFAQPQMPAVVDNSQMRQASTETGAEQQSAPSPMAQTQQSSVENSQRGDGALTRASQRMTGRAGAANRNSRSQTPAQPASRARQANPAWSGANQTPIAAAGRSRAQQPPPRPYPDHQAYEARGSAFFDLMSRRLSQRSADNLALMLNQDWYRPADIPKLSGVNSTPLGERRGPQRPAYQAPPPEGPVAPPRVLPDGQVAMSREEVMFAAAGQITSATMFENWMLFMSQDLSRDYITPAEWEQQAPPQQQSGGQNAAPQARAENARPAKRRRPSRSPDFGPASKRRRDDSALD